MEQTGIFSESELAAHREWLVRLCTRLSGSPDAAEDLTQETLVEAWRSADRLASPDQCRPWLAGIARNVARRWWRSEVRHTGTIPTVRMETLPAGEDADPEQRCLALDLSETVSAGLASVPEASRDALVAYWLEERSQAEIATALGVAEPAVSARVYRGKRALRTALAQPEFRDALAAYGFGRASADPGRETAIRCPLCGIHRLHFHVDMETNSLSVHCAGACLAPADGCIIGRMTLLPDAQRLSSPKAILSRHLLSAYEHYRSLLADGVTACPFCGCSMPVLIGSSASVYEAGVYLSCPRCGCLDDTSLWHLTLDHPATQRFWRRHPRMQALPITHVEHEGLSAVVTGFQSRDASARIEVLYSPARYEVLRIETAAG